MREDSDRLPLPFPQLGPWPATQACALPRNRTGDFLVGGTTPGPLSHTSQGSGELSVPCFNKDC